MTLGKGAERQNHQILRFAVFDLATAEDGETPVEMAGAGSGE